MNTFGHAIKFERIRQNIKQVQLSDGICTPSYLSKIESNSIVPSEKVIGKILKKFNFEKSNMEIPETKFNDYVKMNYKEAILYKDRAKTSLLLKELNQKLYVFPDLIDFYNHQLILLRLNLISHDIQFPTKEILRALSELKENFNTHQQFTFHINLGFLKFFENELDSSLESFQKALNILPSIKCEDWEIADMEYALGLVFAMSKRYVSSIEYTKRSITFFEKHLYYARSIEAYIVLSIAYKYSQKYDEASEILKIAQNIAQKTNHTENLLQLHYNIGAIDTLQGNSKSAVFNYQACITLSNEDWNTATSMIALIIEYAKQRDFSSVIEWSQRGLTLCNNSTDPLIRIKEPHFYCFLAIYGELEDYENTLIKGIKLFEQHDEFRFAHKYSLQLARHYMENKKYKKAALQYKKANEYLSLKENRKFTEDL